MKFRLTSRSPDPLCRFSCFGDRLCSLTSLHFVLWSGLIEGFSFRRLSQFFLFRVVSEVQITSLCRFRVLRNVTGCHSDQDPLQITCISSVALDGMLEEALTLGDGLQRELKGVESRSSSFSFFFRNFFTLSPLHCH